MIKADMTCMSACYSLDNTEVFNSGNVCGMTNANSTPEFRASNLMYEF